MADKIHAAERTRQAIAAAESGDIEDARTLLAEALTLDPDYEPAWLWFAAVADDEGEQKFCLERAQTINPLGAATQGLANLKVVEPKIPAELRKIIDPPPPQFTSGSADDRRAERRRRIFV